jgi:MYXO-CTERM domain-containing protein
VPLSQLTPPACRTAAQCGVPPSPPPPPPPLLLLLLLLLRPVPRARRQGPRLARQLLRRPRGAPGRLRLWLHSLHEA